MEMGIVTVLARDPLVDTMLFGSQGHILVMADAPPNLVETI